MICHLDYGTYLLMSLLAWLLYPFTVYSLYCRQYDPLKVYLTSEHSSTQNSAIVLHLTQIRAKVLSMARGLSWCHLPPSTPSDLLSFTCFSLSTSDWPLRLPPTYLVCPTLGPALRFFPLLKTSFSQMFTWLISLLILSVIPILPNLLLLLYSFFFPLTFT